ncbi:MAG: class I SAM-dependent rRNA methyltransferase [Pseudomonadota bacterium]
MVTATVRLKPKADAQALRHGYPWAYVDDLVLDRRTRAIAPGAFVRLEDAHRVPLGTYAFHAGSKIAARLIDRDPEATIDTAWFADKIATAAAHRTRLYQEPFYRLIHAEADGLPGVIIDRFGDTAAFQPNAAWADTNANAIVQALIEVTGVKTVVLNGSGRARALEGLEDRVDVVHGDVSGPIDVPMNGAVYKADLLGGQKTGLFFDQRDNHAFAAKLAQDADVLDVFSHVGGFGLAMLAGGARSALAVDSSLPALELALQGAAQSGATDRFETRRGDAFKTMETLADEGATFDVVVCDPPAFAPSKKVLTQGLRAYERVARLAAPLVRPGGYLGLCSCSHAADMTRFLRASSRGIGRAGRSANLIHSGAAGPDHPLLPALAESGYLKALFFRLGP